MSFQNIFADNSTALICLKVFLTHFSETRHVSPVSALLISDEAFINDKRNIHSEIITPDGHSSTTGKISLK